MFGTFSFEMILGSVAPSHRLQKLKGCQNRPTCSAQQIRALRPTQCRNVPLKHTTTANVEVTDVSELLVELENLRRENELLRSELRTLKVKI